MDEAGSLDVKSRLWLGAPASPFLPSLSASQCGARSSQPAHIEKFSTHYRNRVINHIFHPMSLIPKQTFKSMNIWVTCWVWTPQTIHLCWICSLLFHSKLCKYTQTHDTRHSYTHSWVSGICWIFYRNPEYSENIKRFQRVGDDSTWHADVCVISNYTLRPYTPLFHVMMISQIMSTLKSLEKKKYKISKARCH